MIPPTFRRYRPERHCSRSGCIGSQVNAWTSVQSSSACRGRPTHDFKEFLELPRTMEVQASSR